MVINGIVFDLDGVIAFTDKFHYKAWKMVAERLNAPFDEVLNNRLRGVSRMESLNIILSNAGLDLSPEKRENIAFVKNEIYRFLLSELSPASIDPDTRETLKILRSHGIKLAIGSSSKNAPLILEKTGLTEYFDAVSNGNNISRPKPDPEVFLKAAAFIGLSPSECAVVEDAAAGIDAAKNGGFYAIGIGDAAKYPRADLRIASLKELLTLMDGGKFCVVIDIRDCSQTGL
ncbi:MAG: beta-phosphoglucomutase [Synergistaceae bacterium]|jgi:beta-phosphoglucomutase|nr:beta-phosphoglucomutase [Synergistaceae bacterium]